MSKGFASNPRIALLASVVLLSFSGLATRLITLHVLERDALIKVIEKTRRRIDPVPARRGDIIDATGSVLATSRTKRVLGVDPQSLLPEDEPKWPELARLIGMPEAELRRIFTTKKRRKPEPQPKPGVDSTFQLKLNLGTIAPLPVAETPASKPAITPDKATLDDVADAQGYRLIQWAELCDGIEEALYDRVMALGIKGVYATREYHRDYPHHSLAAHIVGYVNKAGDPASGVEAYADFFLRGQDGWREGERDGRGREAAQFRTRDVPANDGFTVMLTLDAVVQNIVEAELATIVEEFRPQKATIIVSDPRNGFILALGNYPSFDLNKFFEAPLEVQRNFAITDQFDPGSTFKIVAAAGALNDGLLDPLTRFDCSLSSIEYEGRVRKFMPDDHSYDHPLTVREIISHSSNVGAAQIGMRLGERRLYEYARAFGFGRKTGFPFGGEISGTLHDPSKTRWSALEITRIPAGYSISATPIQIHFAMATIASGGDYLRPQIIGQIRDASGEVVYRFDGMSKQRVVSRPVATQIAEMLQGVVRKGEGTAPEAAIPGYQVAGKTGTAQKLIDGRYSDRNHIGSFVGFFPASMPQVVITVIVDDGKPRSGGSGYGRIVAAPSFKRIGEKLIQYLDIKPPLSELRGQQLVMEGGRR